MPSLASRLTGATGFVGETDHGGPLDNQGFTVTPTGNHAPDVTVPGDFTIPPRTPFALTGSATDPDGNALTYMWEQVDRAGIHGGSTAGTALLSATPRPTARSSASSASPTDIPLTDTLKYHSPGLNLATNNPTRVFPDMGQILANNTNAATGTCPDAPPAPAAVATAIRECFSEFLPTTDWVGFLSDRTMTFRMTARDGGRAAAASASPRPRSRSRRSPARSRSRRSRSREVIFGTTSEDDHVGRRRHRRGADQHRQRQDQPRRRPTSTTIAASTPNDGSWPAPCRTWR